MSLPHAGLFERLYAQRHCCLDIAPFPGTIESLCCCLKHQLRNFHSSKNFIANSTLIREIDFAIRCILVLLICEMLGFRLGRVGLNLS